VIKAFIICQFWCLLFPMLVFNRSDQFSTRDLIHRIRSESMCDMKVPIILSFLNIGECMKCESGLELTIDSAKRLVKHLANVAIVFCHRDVELHSFISQTGWPYGVYRDDGSLKKELGLPEDTRMVVCDARDNVIMAITREQFNPTAFSRIHMAFKKIDK
jgi:hypothetical protein